MGVARLYRVASPFNAAELSDLDVEQSFDTLFLAHLNHKPSKLVRAGHTDWQFSYISFGPTIGIPSNVQATPTTANTDEANSGDAYFPRNARYKVSAVVDDTGQESLPSGHGSCNNDLSLKRNYNTITWDAVAGADRYRIYKANLDGANYGFIGEATGTTFKDDNIDPDLTDGPRQPNSLFTADGDYPSTVFFWEQRLGFARTRNNPNAMFFSRSADLENFQTSRPLKEDDAITIRLVATKVNSINQVVPTTRLLALTSNGLFSIEGSNQDYLTASPPPRQRRQNGRGASRLEPVVADEVVFYTPAIGDEIRAINYSFEVDGYQTNNMAIFSPHFFEGFDIVSWAYADEPLSCVWAVRSDGKLLCFTWQREQEVWGWTMCETSGIYLGVAVIPEVPTGSTIPEHRVYFVVERTINGVRRRFVERMSSAKWSDQKDGCYLDCAISFDLTVAQTDFFVPHLAGATVDVLADGNVYRDKVVGADGYVRGISAAKKVHIGLRYTSLIETLPLALPDRAGGQRAGKVQQLGEIVLRLFKTRGVRAGRKLSDLMPLKTRRSEALGEPKDLLTGDYSAQTEPVASTEATLFVEQSNPLPMTITAIFLDPVQNEV